MAPDASRALDPRSPHPSPARRRTGFTLDELGEQVGVAGSQLSLIENGKREPKLSLLQAIAHATGSRGRRAAVGRAAEPPRRPRDRARPRAVRARCSGSSASRRCKVTKGMSDDTIESILGPAPRAAAPRARGDRDPRGGAPRQHRAAPADARRTTTTSPRSRSSPRSSSRPPGTSRARSPTAR